MRSITANEQSLPRYRGEKRKKSGSEAEREEPGVSSVGVLYTHINKEGKSRQKQDGDRPK